MWAHLVGAGEEVDMWMNGGKERKVFFRIALHVWCLVVVSINDERAEKSQSIVPGVSGLYDWYEW